MEWQSTIAAPQEEGEEEWLEHHHVTRAANKKAQQQQQQQHLDAHLVVVPITCSLCPERRRHMCRQAVLALCVVLLRASLPRVLRTQICEKFVWPSWREGSVWAVKLFCEVPEDCRVAELEAVMPKTPGAKEGFFVQNTARWMQHDEFVGLSPLVWRSKFVYSKILFVDVGITQTRRFDSNWTVGEAVANLLEKLGMDTDRRNFVLSLDGKTPLPRSENLYETLDAYRENDEFPNLYFHNILIPVPASLR